MAVCVRAWPELYKMFDHGFQHEFAYEGLDMDHELLQLKVAGPDPEAGVR